MWQNKNFRYFFYFVECTEKTQNAVIVDYEIELGISEEENYEKLINSYPEDMNLPGRFLKSGNSSESDFLPNLSSDKNNHL